MLSILLVGRDQNAFADFAAQLSKREGLRVTRVASAKEAWGLLNNSRIDVVVVDEKLTDEAALAFVNTLTKQQPLINCAMVSKFAPKDFHEATEGLGVFMQLPVDPGADEAAKMMQLLESINALMTK